MSPLPLCGLRSRWPTSTGRSVPAEAGKSAGIWGAAATHNNSIGVVVGAHEGAADQKARFRRRPPIQGPLGELIVGDSCVSSTLLNNCCIDNLLIAQCNRLFIFAKLQS